MQQHANKKNSGLKGSAPADSEKTEEWSLLRPDPTPKRYSKRRFQSEATKIYHW